MPDEMIECWYCCQPIDKKEHYMEVQEGYMDKDCYRFLVEEGYFVGRW